MRKATLAVQTIEKRIAHADHIMAGVPSERQLADELGLSRNTVRVAVQHLVQKGVLVRQNNGRLNVAPPSNPQRRTLCFIVPAGHSTDVDEWRQSVVGLLEGTFQDYDVTLRNIPQGHWGDPVIQEALSSFDGAYFLAPAEKIPNWLIAKMKDSPCRVVVLDQDVSAVGLPSVVLFPPAAEHKLFDHLYNLGHRQIDCLNTQETGAVVAGRMTVWKEYLASRGIKGKLHSVEKRKPVESAYEYIRDALRSGVPLASAIFCTTGPAALGAMRAFYEGGLKVGVDVSVCAVNSEGIGRYLMPSLTALESPPRSLYLRQASEWIITGEEWHGPLLIQPDDVPLFQGESTGPALAE
ncbi:putative HTH-type transcriptional repressor ExuR [Abditibacteriota bacterium]|nr:putative HTH-type transcriptional repressor ExuR [Abditibacteriota bacterium]